MIRRVMISRETVRHGERDVVINIQLIRQSGIFYMNRDAQLRTWNAIEWALWGSDGSGVSKVCWYSRQTFTHQTKRLRRTSLDPCGSSIVYMI